MLKKRISYLFVFLCCLMFAYIYVFEQPHRNYIHEEASFELTAANLFLDFINNENRSNKIYLNKIIKIEGYITSMKKNKNSVSILLDEKVFCIFNNSLIESNRDSSFVRLKGRCTGYDDIFMQVTLDNCIIIE